MSVACNLFWIYSVGLISNCKANILIDLQLSVGAPFEKIFVHIFASGVCYEVETAYYYIFSSEK